MYCFFIDLMIKKNKIILTRRIKQCLFFNQLEAFSLSGFYRCFPELFSNVLTILSYQCQKTNAAKGFSIYIILKKITLFCY